MTAHGQPRRLGYAWVVVAVAFCTTVMAVGVRGAFGVFLVPLVEAFGWSRGLVAGAIAANALLWAVSAAPWGALLDRLGPRVAYGGAAVLAGAGLLVAATTNAPWQLYLGIGVLAGAGLAPLQVNSQGVVVAHWFARRRGLALGLVAAGAGLGVMLLAPLSQWLIDAAGWRVALVVLAALFLLGVAPLNALLQRHRPAADAVAQSTETGARSAGAPGAAAPSGDPAATAPGTRPIASDRDAEAPTRAADTTPVASGTRPPARPPPAPASDGPTVAVALRHPRFWLLAAGYLIGAVPVALLLAHTVAYLIDAGFAPPLAAAVFGFSGACAVGGMLLLGWVADRWSGEWAYSIGSAALVVGMAVLHASGLGREWLLPLFAVLFALGWASRQGIHAFMGAAIGQGRSLGALMGLLAAHTAAGSAVGPALGGWVFDATGSYHLALAIAAGCAVAGAACIWLAAPRHGPLVARPAAARGALAAGR